MELALLILLVITNSKVGLLRNKKWIPCSVDTSTNTQPAPDAADEALKKARKQYEEELAAFQVLMNYNADVAYGVNNELKE